MSGQLTPEEAAALVLYLEKDPNLPPFLASVVVWKLKSLITPGAAFASSTSTVRSFKLFLYECVLDYFLEPHWTPLESCWTFHGVGHTHIFNYSRISVVSSGLYGMIF